MENMLKQSASHQHIVWLDVVRFIAMFTVVCCHSSDPFNYYPGEPPGNIDEIKFWGAAYGAILRPCVPLFVMITGALLLPVKGDVSSFYKKRISRVFFPFLIWSVLYNLFPWVTGLLGLSPQVILDFFPYASGESMRQSLEASLSYIANIPFNFSLFDVHMWYIYLLIGLYLYMPIFSAWVEKVNEKAKLWFLVVWGITLFIPYYRAFVTPYLWGSCSWNEFHMLFYFAGFNGYILLGHYLRYREWSWTKTLGWGIPLLISGFMVTFYGFRYMAANPACTLEQLDLFFYYCSPNVVMMTIPLFMFAKKVHITNERIRKVLANLTVCGFGVYMIHYLFTGPSVILARVLQLPVSLQIPFAAIVAFAISWLLVNVLRCAFGRYSRYVLG